MIRAARDIVLLGGSAGALVAVKAIVSALPDDFSGSMFVVMHRGPDPPSRLALTDVLSQQTALPAETAYDTQPIVPGHIYVAPPDFHMVLVNGLICLEQGPKEKGFRPSIDVTFKS